MLSEGAFPGGETMPSWAQAATSMDAAAAKGRIDRMALENCGGKN